MRPLGTFNIPTNFDTKIEWTFDSRQMVQSYVDLLTFTWENYIPIGFIVAVYDTDPELRGVYMNIDNQNLELPESWEKISCCKEDTVYQSDVDFNFEVPEKNAILTILIISQNSDTIYLGLTPGGDELYRDGVDVDEVEYVTMNRYFKNAPINVYVSGITGPTTLIIWYKDFRNLIT